MVCLCASCNRSPIIQYEQAIEFQSDSFCLDLENQFSRVEFVPNSEIDLFFAGEKNYTIDKRLTSEKIHFQNNQSTPITPSIQEGEKWVELLVYDKYRKSFREIVIPTYWKMDTMYYFPYISSFYDFCQLDSDVFITYLLPAPQYDVSTAAEIKYYVSNSKMGRIVIGESDTGNLQHYYEPYPNHGAVVNSNNYLSSLPTYANVGNDLYFTYSWLDTIYKLDRQGKLLSKIVLPNKPAPGKFHIAPEARYSSYDYDRSQLDNIFVEIRYNHLNHTLNVVLREPCEIGNNALLKPKSTDKNWLLYIYDLKKEKWKSSIRFTKDYDPNNLLFLKESVMVKNRNCEKLCFETFDVY